MIVNLQQEISSLKKIKNKDTDPELLIIGIYPSAQIIIVRVMKLMTPLPTTAQNTVHQKRII